MADNSVKMAENQYISMKAKFDSQLVSTKSQLDSINWQMDLASQQLSNSIIRAPFDWVVTVKNIEVWSLVSPWVQAFSVANNEDKIVKLDLSSDNIKYLSIWKPVDLEKDNIMYSWIVSTVWVSADPMTKMYKVEIKFDSKMDISKLVLGSFIDVFIKKENTKETYIIVPFSSLITNSSSEYYVYVVWSWSLVESKKVNIWPSNSHEIVITDWLIEWERVVTNWSLSVDVWDSVEEIK